MIWRPCGSEIAGFVVRDRARRDYDGGTKPRPTLDDLIADPIRARELTADEAAALLIALAPVRQALQLVALAPPSAAPASDAPGVAPTHLTLAEAADRARKSRRWMRDHRRVIPGSKKVGRDTVFAVRPFEKWLNRC